MGIFLALLAIGLFFLGLHQGWTGAWMSALVIGFYVAKAYLHGAVRKLPSSDWPGWDN